MLHGYNLLENIEGMTSYKLRTIEILSVLFRRIQPVFYFLSSSVAKKILTNLASCSCRGMYAKYV